MYYLRGISDNLAAKPFCLTSLCHMDVLKPFPATKAGELIQGVLLCEQGLHLTVGCSRFVEKKGKANEVQSPGLSWELWNGMDGMHSLC